MNETRTTYTGPKIIGFLRLSEEVLSGQFFMKCVVSSRTNDYANLRLRLEDNLQSRRLVIKY